MVKAEKLCFSYTNMEILKNISFELTEGETCAVIGKNGAGKTTLLKVLSGLAKLQSGTITLNNNVVEYTGKVYENVSFLRQSEMCNANLTVFESVLLAVKDSSFFVKSVEKKRVEDILSKLKILDLSNRYLYELSGGQLKMVFIAQALCGNKNILLLDEPISNLDYHNQLFVLKKIQTISKKNKLTTLITIHDVNMALAFADKALVIHKGQVYNFGTPEEVINEEMMKNVFEVNAVSYEICNKKYINLVSAIE